MTCQSSKVPTTPMSTSHVDGLTRQNRRHASRTRRPDRRSSTASATIDASTQMTPSTITPSFSAVGAVMNRVSTSMRAERPGWAATRRSVNTPTT